MIKKKARRKKAVQQKRDNLRMSFDDLCVSWRPVFDYCLSQEGDAVFGKEIPDAVLAHIKKVARQNDPNAAFGCLGFALQTLLVGYAHLLNAVEHANPGVKPKALREFLNSMNQRAEEPAVGGLPAGE